MNGERFLNAAPWIIGVLTIFMIGFAVWHDAKPCEAGHTERQTVCVDMRHRYCAAYAEREVFVCDRRTP